MKKTRKHRDKRYKRQPKAQRLLFPAYLTLNSSKNDVFELLSANKQIFRKTSKSKEWKGKHEKNKLIRK